MPHLLRTMLLTGRLCIQERLFGVEDLPVGGEIEGIADPESELVVDLAG